MSLTTITTEGYFNLSNAIIVQALKDLEQSENQLARFKQRKQKPGAVMSEEDKVELKGLEDSVNNHLNWFGSQDYYGYTSLHPDIVLQAYRDAHMVGHTMRMIGKKTAKKKETKLKRKKEEANGLRRKGAAEKHAG